jgi:hypothetical protein
MGDHNIRLVGNYISGVDDERYIRADGSVNVALITPAGNYPGNQGNFLPSYWGVHGEDWKSVDAHYVWSASWATLSFSIINVADEAPPPSRQEMGYDPRIGSPLGRQIEVGLRKAF